ncbi:MAG: VCBS repeat-containing protein [Pseudomonadota bacterium]
MKDCSFIAAIFILLPGCAVAGKASEEMPFSRELIQLQQGENALYPVDLDGDGTTELIIVSEDSRRLEIRRSDFASPASAADTYVMAAMPTSIDSADMDGDGNLDLAVAHHESAVFSIAFGDGTGSISRIEQFPLPQEIAPHVHMIKAIDLGGDGIMDVAVDSRDNYGLFVLRNTGKADSFVPLPVETNTRPYLGFTVGDINSDGLTDAVAPGPDQISVLLQSRATLPSLVSTQSLNIEDPFSLELADINDDGHLDLIAVSQAAAGGLTVFEGSATGSFSSKPLMQFDLVEGAKQVAAGDVDMDGRTDIVVASWFGEVTVVLNHTSGPQVERFSLEGVDAPWSLAIADFGASDRNKMLVADGENGRAVLLDWNDS